jgi:hypothetical protein
MGFLLLLLYLIATYLSPEQLFPALAPYRVVLCITIAALVASIPVLLEARWLTKLPQTYLLFGLLGTMVFSEIAHLWFGGVLFALESFLPAMVIFFLICIHVNTWNRLRILVVVLSGIALELLAHDLWNLHNGNLESAYLMVMNPESSSPIIRIRAVGYLNDPNDFAQFLLIVIPLVAVAWAKGEKLRNLFLVVLPCALLTYGVYLTHSRGAMLALAILAVIFLSRRVPLWVSIACGTLLLVGMKVSGFTGGRDISADAGSERLDLWGMGLQMFRGSPLWGVGYGRFMNFAFLTAHNSFVLCLAEVGLIGYFFWLALLVISFLQLNSLAPFSESLGRKSKEAVPASPSDTRSLNASSLRAVVSKSPQQNLALQGSKRRPQSRAMAEEPIRAEDAEKNAENVRRWATALRFCLIAFVVTGWFLSRTYTMTLYVVLGINVALLYLAKVPSEEMQVRGKWVRTTLAVEAGSIVMLYVMLRVSWLFVH